MIGVEETVVPGENHWSAASHWQTLPHNKTCYWTEPSHDYIFMPNLGLIKFIVSEKMLLFDFPIGCYMYVKAMPCWSIQLGLWCIKSHSTICQLYRGNHD
jgi:hypothetical protein